MQRLIDEPIKMRKKAKLTSSIFLLFFATISITLSLFFLGWNYIDGTKLEWITLWDLIQVPQEQWTDNDWWMIGSLVLGIGAMALATLLAIFNRFFKTGGFSVFLRIIIFLLIGIAIGLLLKGMLMFHYVPKNPPISLPDNLSSGLGLDTNSLADYDLTKYTDNFKNFNLDDASLPPGVDSRTKSAIEAAIQRKINEQLAETLKDIKLEIKNSLDGVKSSIQSKIESHPIKDQINKMIETANNYIAKFNFIRPYILYGAVLSPTILPILRTGTNIFLK